MKARLRIQNISKALAFAMVAIILATCAIVISGCSASKASDDESVKGINVAGFDAMGYKTTITVKTSAGATATYRSEKERKAESDSDNSTKPGKRVVYLTFDDGPSSNTQSILDALDQYGVKATWFIKADQSNVDMTKTIWEKGNQIAIHTYSHDYKSIYASTDAFWSDIDKAGSIIESQIGFKPTIFRFPGGSRNSFNTKISNALISQASEKGMHYFDWNVSCGDGGGNHDADFAYNKVVSSSEGCNSCCVLMHDSSGLPATVEALPSIIEHFIEEGYTFDVLTSSSYGYHY